VELSAIALQGLDSAQAALERTAVRLARTGSDTPEAAPTDTVELATAMVGLIAARQDYAVNLKVLETANEIERQAVDLLA
jgi:hypothetical protein